MQKQAVDRIAEPGSVNTVGKAANEAPGDERTIRSEGEDTGVDEAHAARVDRALGDLASAVNDADFYCSEYST